MVALQAEHRAFLLLQHLFLAGIRQLARVQVEHIRRGDPDAAVANVQLHGRVYIRGAALDGAENPVGEHHLLHGAGDIPGDVQNGLRIGIAGDKVDGLAGGQAFQQFVERLRIAAGAHHVAGNEHRVVIQRADLAQYRGLFIAETPAIEVGEQQYAVAFQILRQTDHGHLLLIHGNAVALQKHHDGQQKHDDHEKYRPEREAHVTAEQAQRVETPP